MKRSQVLYGILLTLVLAVVVVVFALPQKVLDDLEFLFLWIVVPVIGVLWIRAYVDGMRGN